MVAVHRLSTLDSSFLRVESPEAHMHVGWLATLRLPEGRESLDGDALAQRIAARLHLAPRFRQRVTSAAVGEPAWSDDPSFRLERHVQVRAGPELSGEELSQLTGEFFSEQLSRDRPLWQIEVIPRAAGGAAILGKVHHAMVDGIAAVELGTLLFDLAPDAALPEQADWDPQPAAGGLEQAFDAVIDNAVDQFRTARRLAGMGLTPRRTLRVAETMRRAALQIAEDVARPAPPSYLNVPICPRRALITERLPLARFERIKRERDVKLNDVVLAVVSGAMRRFAALNEEEPKPLRAMVPVSVRASGEKATAGNRITFAFIDLPIEEPRAARRLAVVAGRMNELKSSGRIGGSEVILKGTEQLPGFLKERAARLAASPRMYNLTVSNVPGPRIPLYAAGAEVEAIYPVIPNSDEHAIAIGVLTYRDSIHFAFYVDPLVLEQAPELAGLTRAALEELEAAVEARPPAKRPRARGAHTAASADRHANR